VCELADGAADRYGMNPPTCAPDGIPDVCQPAPDCDGDGIPNFCALAAGAADLYTGGATPSCVPNGVPDACEALADCDGDGLPDFCELAAGALDCDGNAVPDNCQPDCDADGLADACEADCDRDGLPDDCEPLLVDCNANGIPDECDALDPNRIDCDGDGQLDECQPDCDANQRPDSCDILAEPERDRDRNGALDACECDMIHRRNPASLLLYVEYDNRTAAQTLVSVTNVLPLPVEVHFEFVDAATCHEFDFTRVLTGEDTLTFFTRAVNPNSTQGFVYAYAQELGTHRPLVFNGLIGQLVALNGIAGASHSVNAVAFRGIGNGVYTDLDSDGHRDLNGLEYAPAPEELLVPRFLGQTNAIQSELVLVALSGGAAFTTTVDFLVYNDNEAVFSAQYAFHCWARVPLLEISGFFDNAFLADASGSEPLEILGAPYQESGWMRINGNLAQSTAKVVTDPAIYAVLVERTGSSAAADLPFEVCAQKNGSLLPLSLFGDNDD